jgi:hypothetical protein
MDRISKFEVKTKTFFLRKHARLTFMNTLQQLSAMEVFPAINIMLISILLETLSKLPQLLLSSLYQQSLQREKKWHHQTNDHLN